MVFQALVPSVLPKARDQIWRSWKPCGKFHELNQGKIYIPSQKDRNALVQKGCKGAGLIKEVEYIMGGGRVTEVSSMAEWNGIHAKAGNRAVNGFLDFLTPTADPLKLVNIFHFTHLDGYLGQ